MKYFDTECFHCKNELHQRQDTFKRQQHKYGHSCCKHCFGKEQTFSDARVREMTINNPFKGKKHSDETKQNIAVKKIGSISWNKGLTKNNHPEIAKYGKTISAYKKLNPPIGDKNPNWKGGITKMIRPIPESLKEWLAFRKTVIERDIQKCWKCESSKRLEVHHLASATRFPELKFDELNCMVLCRKCHREFHKKYGIKKFEYQDTIVWINESRSEENKLVMC